VLYTLGGGLDHPLDIIRLDWYNDVIVPVYSWRGRAVTGFCVNSSQFCAQDFTWPAQTENAQFDDPPVTDPEFGGPVAWGGNIIDTQQDGSGLIYKRNRYYDPASGRFTQVDPIGLGGGLSAYGFGGGDQVSYTDPFGTCPPKDKVPCKMDTGDKNLDNPAIRQNLEDSVNSAPADAANPGYVDEIAGYCGTSNCSSNPGDVNTASPGNMRPGDALEYHTHMNAGKPALIPGKPGYVYVARPSKQDSTSAGTRSVPSYVIGPKTIYRNSPNGKGGVTTTCFERWSNSAPACPPK
jgi:RHS repeat-associated protein